jgi:CheY-like chemotaxis protein
MNYQRNIFVVDDSKIIADIMKKVISSIAGVTVTDFRNGRTFLNGLHDTVPDMIFLDYYLDAENRREPNGEEIFFRVKKSHPEIPIVLITGINDPEKLEHFRQIGFTDVINKDEPEIFNHIITCVEHLRD